MIFTEITTQKGKKTINLSNVKYITNDDGNAYFTFIDGSYIKSSSEYDRILTSLDQEEILI
jgi:hypothetical protein